MESASEIFKRHYDAWEKDPKRMRSGYDYEKTYSEMMQKVEQEVLSFSVGKVSNKSSNKKNFKPVLGT